MNKALGPRATQVLSAEGATFRGVNGGTPSWPRARMTSPPFAPHPFGDHPRFSPCAGATGKLVLTARVLGEGGARPAGTGPAPGLRYGQHCACWAQRPGPLLPLPVSIYGTSPLSWGPGLLPDRTEQAANSGKLCCGLSQARGCLLGRAASLGDQVQNASGNRKSMRQRPSKLLLGCPGAWDHLRIGVGPMQ